MAAAALDEGAGSEAMKDYTNSQMRALIDEHIH